MSKSENKSEKSKVAALSVGAAAALTAMKLAVGLATGSLGILSEALHSAVDMLAAGATYLAVNFSGKPADNEHNFGHGKIENISALAEALLLLGIAGWIIWEAVERLAGKYAELEIGFWSFAVVSVSLVVDIGRASALSRAAKKYKSQALEADALHFSTDILSSAAVLAGLAFAYFGVHSADPAAALCVAAIIAAVSLRLCSRAIDELLDKAPEGLRGEVDEILNGVDGVIKSHDLRVRACGGVNIIDVNIHVSPTLNIVQAHEISERAEALLRDKLGDSIINIHVEPE